MTAKQEEPKVVRRFVIEARSDGNVQVQGHVGDNPLTILDIFARAMTAIVSHQIASKNNIVVPKPNISL